jgi:putative flavoprotein involved in K+ transport
MYRLLDAVDQYIDAPRSHRPPALVAPAPTADLDLHRAGITTVLVASGYRPDYPWLRLPIRGSDGHIRQNRGVTAAPGVYVVGQRFQHRRDSAFIDGARHDAAAVVRHLTACNEEPAA